VVDQAVIRDVPDALAVEVVGSRTETRYSVIIMRETSGACLSLLPKIEVTCTGRWDVPRAEQTLEMEGVELGVNVFDEHSLFVSELTQCIKPDLLTVLLSYSPPAPPKVGLISYIIFSA
jgi:hypothetical protein